MTGIAMAISMMCVAPLVDNCFAYEADDASTPTLWQIKDKAERVAADKKRRGEYYAGKMEQFLAEENLTTGGIVFIGDSITDRFPLNKAFPNGWRGKKVYNRGIGGDRIEGILERLDVGIIDLQPSEIYVMIGSNDIVWPVDYRNGNLGPGYRRLFKALKATAPQAEIVAFNCLPLNENMDRLGTCIKDTFTANKQLEEVCKEENIKVINTHGNCATPEGTYREGMHSDGIHLSVSGYLTWLDLLLSPKEKFEVWKNLAKEYDAREGFSSPITGVNQPRKLHDLILYRKTEGSETTSTGTNKFGLEAVVQNDTVTSFSRRGDMPLPDLPGYVLSGIGDKRDWMMSNANMGAKIKLSKDGKSVRSIKSEPKDAFGWYCMLRGMVLSKLARANGNAAKINELEKIALRLESVRKGDTSKVKKLRKTIQQVGKKKIAQKGKAPNDKAKDKKNKKAQK